MTAFLACYTHTLHSQSLHRASRLARTPPFKAGGPGPALGLGGGGRGGGAGPTAHAQAGLCASRGPAGPSRASVLPARALRVHGGATEGAAAAAGPRAPALPLGAGTHRTVEAAGGRTVLASAPPTPLPHQAHFRPLRGGSLPGRHVTWALPMASPSRGTGPPPSLLGNVEDQEVEWERPADVSFCGLSFRLGVG